MSELARSRGVSSQLARTVLTCSLTPGAGTKGLALERSVCMSSGSASSQPAPAGGGVKVCVRAVSASPAVKTRLALRTLVMSVGARWRGWLVAGLRLLYLARSGLLDDGVVRVGVVALGDLEQQALGV